MYRRLLGILLTAIFSLTPAAKGADPLEGDWRINGGGAVLRFVQRADPADNTLDILWIDGEAIDIAPLTPIGTATPGAEAGVYDCSLVRSTTGRRTKANMAIRMQGGEALSFESYRRNARLSLWRLVPYLFRVSIITSTTRPSGLDGARRVGAPPPFIVI